MERTHAALNGMSISEKLSEKMLADEGIASVIRDLRLAGTKLADIGNELLDRSLVEQTVGKGVLVSAVSRTARLLLGNIIANEIAAKNRHVVTADELGDGWKTWQAAGTLAAAKAKGHYWEFEHDRILRDVVETYCDASWDEISWFLRHQHGIEANAKACSVRYYKITRMTPVDDEGSDAVEIFHIDDYR